MVTRERHPFEGHSLAVITSIRRRGVRLVLVVLPNGTRSLIPVAWTDWNGEQSAEIPADSHFSHDLGRLDELLHLRTIINALLSRPAESAPHQGSSDAIALCHSGSDGSASEPDTDKSPDQQIDEADRMVALEVLARLIAQMLAAQEAREMPDE